MLREEMLAKVDAAYDARRSGNLTAFAELVSTDGVFSFAGDQSLLVGLPGAGERTIQEAAKDIAQSIELQTLERVEAVAEGDRVAIMWRSTVAIAGREPFETLFFDLWEFNGEGKIRRGTQFIDTAKFVSVLRPGG